MQLITVAVKNPVAGQAPRVPWLAKFTQCVLFRGGVVGGQGIPDRETCFSVEAEAELIENDAESLFAGQLRARDTQLVRSERTRVRPRV